jgi:hypothetical protein
MLFWCSMTICYLLPCVVALEEEEEEREEEKRREESGQEEDAWEEAQEGGKEEREKRTNPHTQPSQRVRDMCRCLTVTLALPTHGPKPSGFWRRTAHYLPP